MDILKKAETKSPKKRATQNSYDKIRVAGYLVLSLSALTVFFLLKLHVFKVFGNYLEILQKVSLGTSIVSVILLAAKLAERLLTRRTRVVYTRYNLTKMVRLLSWLLILAVGVSFLFSNWYSAAVSLGLISLILGFALQNPISSFNRLALHPHPAALSCG